MRHVLEELDLITGETICMNNNEPFRRDGANHCYFETIPASFAESRFTFGFVRHPLTWYQSFWAYRMHTGWHNSADYIQSNDFNEFVRLRTTYWPGFLLRHYDKYCFRNDGTSISFIGQYEHLASDLISALSQAGESFQVETILSLQRSNAAASLSKWSSSCIYQPETAQLVLEAERETIEKYGYADMDMSHILNAHVQIECYS